MRSARAASSRLESRLTSSFSISAFSLCWVRSSIQSNSDSAEGAGDFQAASPGGKNLHYGIREHAMAAIVNGLSLSRLRAFGATFFIFSDYARPAIGSKS